MTASGRVCASCQTPLPPEARFCLGCGAPTPTGAEGPAANTPPSDEQFQRLKQALADRYRIEQVAGYGGMATVYLAEDLRHRRKVAVKVLRPDWTAMVGGERFLREIGIAAQLQHPHILTLIDSGEADGFLYYVMPYVEGESLRQKLAREGELPIGDAVSILHDVVDALAHAHARGVVHRDIKPDNVLLSGRHALVVDFGVAKALSQATGQFAPTTAGLSLGTPAYMAPEQAVADPQIDHRADLYAVGVLAYELLSGSPPIEGETAQAVLAAQVTKVPRPIDEVRPTVPPALAQLVMRCLEKRPADRWQSADELRPQLEVLTTPSLGMTPPMTKPVPSARPRWVRWVAVGTVAVAAAVVWLIAMRNNGPRAAPSPPTSTQLTYEGNVGPVALSPDGQYLAYAVLGSAAKVMVQDLAGGTSITIVDSVSELVGIRWSADGARVGIAGTYRGVYGTYLFPRLGGTPRRVFDWGQYMAWSPDGSRLAAWHHSAKEWGIWIGDLASGRSDTLRSLPGSDKWLGDGDWSPDGRLLALNTHSETGPSALWIINVLDSTAQLTYVDSTDLGTPRWGPSGDDIYYASEQDVYRIAVDGATGEAVGGPQRVVSIDDATSFMGYDYDLSTDGRRLVYTRTTGYTNFSIAHPSRDGRSFDRVPLSSGTADKFCPMLAPDGRSLAFVQESSEGFDLYRVQATGGSLERLTFDGAVGGWCPAWSPTGSTLAFVTQAGGGARVALVPASGGSVRIFEDAVTSGQIAWHPGPRITYQLPGNRNFRLLDPETEQEQPLREDDSVGWMFLPANAPDGIRVAVHWNRSSTRGLWIISPADSLRLELAQGAVYPVGWSEDGESVYGIDRASGLIRQYSPRGGDGVIIGGPEFDGASCRPDERKGDLMWVCEEGEWFSDAWMIENFDPEYASEQGR